MAKIFVRNKIAKIVDNIYSIIINDDDIGRLLFYDSTSPFTQSTLTVAQKMSLKNSKLFKTSGNRNLENVSGSFITMRPNNIRVSSNNSNAISYRVDFYIVTHAGSAETVDGNRDYLLLEAILRLFHKEDTVGVGQGELIEARDLVFNSNDFSGYIATIGFVYDVMR